MISAPVTPPPLCPPPLLEAPCGVRRIGRSGGASLVGPRQVIARSAGGASAPSLPWRMCSLLSVAPTLEGSGITTAFPQGSLTPKTLWKENKARYQAGLLFHRALTPKASAPAPQQDTSWVKCRVCKTFLPVGIHPNWACKDCQPASDPNAASSDAQSAPAQGSPPTITVDSDSGEEP